MYLYFSESFKDKNGNTRQTNFKQQILSGKKKHTIRRDRSNRWNENSAIQMASGIGGKPFFQNKKVCTGTQKIEIRADIILVDGHQLTNEQKLHLAHNDGFKDFAAFKAYFAGKLPYTGKIIHWAGLKY